MKELRKRILLFIKVPPPITGATLMNKYVSDSILLKENFIIRSIHISYTKSIDNFGKFNLYTLITFIRIFIILIWECIFHRPQLVYFQISPHGIAFMRDLLFVSITKLFKIKIVYHLHGKGIKQIVKNKLSQVPYKYAFRNSEIICMSNFLKSDVEDVFKGTIHILNNGIRDIFGERINQSQRVENYCGMKILFLSNLIHSKGILDFIEALKSLVNKNIEFNASIVGAEGDIKSCQIDNKIDECHLTGKVFYLGPKYGDEKIAIIEESDVLVYPTLNDSFPLVILEIMQFGKPVIASREGAIPEIVENGITGFLVDKRSPEQITEKLEIFINNPELIKIMGSAGRKKYLERYTLEIFEKNLKEVFTEILNKK